MTEYRPKDAARDTDSTIKQVKRAHHDSRDQSGVRGNDGSDRSTPAERQAGKDLTERILKRARLREDRSRER